MKRQATIKDVSKLAQVSTATVSRAINDPKSVREETRQRIEAAINALSYHSNALAAGLKSGNSGVIGYIVPDMQIRYYNEIFHIINSKLDSVGYSVLVATHNNNPSQEIKVVEKLLERKVAALVVATSLDNASIYEQIDENECPVILIDRKLGSAKLSMVSENCEETSCALMRHVLECGHKRILILTCLPHLTIMAERLEGCRRAIKENSDGDIRMDCLDSRANSHLVREAIKDYFQKFAPEDRPTAIVSLNPRVTEGALLALRDLAVGVPEEVSLVSFGGLNSELIQPDITCVIQNGELIGKKAAEILLACLKSNREDDSHINIIVNDKLHFADSVKRLDALYSECGRMS